MHMHSVSVGRRATTGAMVAVKEAGGEDLQMFRDLILFAL